MAGTFSGEALNKRLAELGWSRRRAAKELETSTNSLNNWLHGAMPQSRKLKRIAEVLGMDIDDLFEEEPADAPSGSGITREDLEGVVGPLLDQRLREQLEQLERTLVGAISQQLQQMELRLAQQIDTLGVSSHGRRSAAPPIISTPLSITEGSRRPSPLYLDLPAGHGLEMERVESSYYAPSFPGARTALARISGSSMEPTLPDDCIVVLLSFDPVIRLEPALDGTNHPAALESELPEDSIIVARVNGEMLTCKRCHYDLTGLWLVADNEEAEGFPLQVTPADYLEVYARVVARGIEPQANVVEEEED